MSEAGRTLYSLDDDIPSIEYRVSGLFNNASPPRMREFLQEFLDTTDLHDHQAIFNKAMYLAQHPDAYNEGENGIPKNPEQDHARQNPGNFPEDDPARELAVSKADRAILELEVLKDKTSSKERKWRRPRLMPFELSKWRQLPSEVKYTVFVCGLGAMMQGIDRAVINGAQGLYLTNFRISRLSQSGTALTENAGPAGLINAAPYLCCVLSCLLTPQLNHDLGRRGAIFLCALCSIFFTYAQAFARTWQEVLLYRLLMGVGIGPMSATIPIYAAEIAPAHIRGSLVTCWQAFTALGVAIGCLSSIVLHQWGDFQIPSLRKFDEYRGLRLLNSRYSWHWKVMLVFSMLPPILLVLFIFSCPESPRWTVAKARQLQREGRPKFAKHYLAKAFATLRKLSRSELVAARDMFTLFFSVKEEYQAKKKYRDERNQTWIGRKVGHLFSESSDRNRRAIQASMVCVIAQQLCGVNVLICYSNPFLQRAEGSARSWEASSKKALLHTMGLEIVNFVFALSAFPLIDTMGRRNLLLTTLPCLALSHITMAWSDALPDVNMEKMFLVGYYIFGVFHSLGEGPVPFFYATERMSVSIREEGMGLVTSINWFSKFLKTFTAPYLFNSRLGVRGTFAVYAAVCTILWGFVLILVPETSLLTLEELDQVFKPPSIRALASHAFETFKYWLFNRSEDPPKPLYSDLPTRANVDLERHPSDQDRGRKGSVSWTCSCGTRLSDSYIELVPGSLAELQRDLQRSFSRTQSSWMSHWLHNMYLKVRPKSSASEQVQNSGNAAVQLSRGQSLVVSSSTSSTSGQVPLVPGATSVHSPAATPASTVLHEPIQSYVLLCIPEGLSGLRLHHQDLNFQDQSHQYYVSDDRSFWSLVHGRYLAQRKIWFSRFWPKTVIRVSLANFVVDLNDFVDLLHYSCQAGTKQVDCKCLPPQDQLYPHPHALYYCQPRSPPHIPPLGTNYLTHYFQHPDHIQNRKLRRVLDQVPKRLSYCLAAQCSSSSGTIEAWGLEFEEGWDRLRLRNGIVLIGTASFVLCLIFSVVSHDVQSGASLAQYLIGFLALAVSYIALSGPRVDAGKA